MPLPVAHGIIGAMIIAGGRDDFSLTRDWKYLLLGAAVAILPDSDLILSWGLGFNLKAHGGFTHSMVFALALGSVVSLIAREKTVKGVLAYMAAALSHGLLDMVTKKEFGGAQLLWPFSDQRYRLGILSNYEFYPDPNTQQLSKILEQVIAISMYELLILLPPFILILYIKSQLSARKRKRQRRLWFEV